MHVYSLNSNEPKTTALLQYSMSQSIFHYVHRFACLQNLVNIFSSLSSSLLENKKLITRVRINKPERRLNRKDEKFSIIIFVSFILRCFFSFFLSIFIHPDKMCKSLWDHMSYLQATNALLIIVSSEWTVLSATRYRISSSPFSPKFKVIYSNEDEMREKTRKYEVIWKHPCILCLATSYSSRNNRRMQLEDGEENVETTYSSRIPSFNLNLTSKIVHLLFPWYFAFVGFY